MTDDAYRTIEAPSEGVYREKMSRFLAFAHPVATVEEAKEIVRDYGKRYFDARHVCWAYSVGSGSSLQALGNDNGEPSGTAGKPILGQINSFGLTDLVIVVVRYFGGIKLGTSGLIVAYREAAREALGAAVIAERYRQATLSFTFPYLAMNDVMRAIKQPVPVGGESPKSAVSDLRILEQQFDNACSMTVSLRAAAAPLLAARLEDIDGVCLCDGAGASAPPS